MLPTKCTTRAAEVFACLFLLSGCQTAPEIKPDEATAKKPAGEDKGTGEGADPTESDKAASVAFRPRAQHPALDALVWTQASAEYDACTAQSYNAAKFMLHHAIPSRTWTALPDLQRGASIRRLPKAVILDIDETVLDNTPYQARLIRDGETFRKESWEAWCREAKAEPIAGAVSFAQHAASKNIRVFYITNRDKSLEEATRENLKRHGFPLDRGTDTVLMRGEKPEWATADKETRRQAIARAYRVLLIIGDNLGDFVSGYKTDPGERQQLFETNAEMWGNRWIMLPNPLYGSWEGALYEQNYERTSSEKGTLKIKALRYQDTQEAP